MNHHEKLVILAEKSWKFFVRASITVLILALIAIGLTIYGYNNITIN